MIYKVVIMPNCPEPTEFIFQSEDKATTFAEEYHKYINEFVDIQIFGETLMDKVWKAWMKNKAILQFRDIKFIKGNEITEDNLPF